MPERSKAQELAKKLRAIGERTEKPTERNRKTLYEAADLLSAPPALNLEADDKEAAQWMREAIEEGLGLTLNAENEGTHHAR